MKTAIVTLIILLSAVSAKAELIVRGTDSLGNQLIYDSDFDITWYDYTSSYDTWDNQMSWASGLSLSGGNLIDVYDDWRLPTALNQDGSGPCIYSNCSGSDMGHLYYTELGNVADETPPHNGLQNSGDFQNLRSDNLGAYWSSTKSIDQPNRAWFFLFELGRQDFHHNDGNILYAMAVRSGDVSVVPEPISSTLLIVGGATLGFRRFIRRRK